MMMADALILIAAAVFFVWAICMMAKIMTE